MLTLTQESTVVVSLGEIKLSKDPQTVLTCLGLGSCIGLCMYDPIAGVGGMAHIVLPFSNNGAAGNAKFADIAIPQLLQAMREHNAVRSRLITKLAGGAQMIKPGTADNFNTGQRNIEAVKQILADEAIRVSAAEVGGSRGRSLKLFVGTGKVMVKSVGSTDVAL
ncbi:MAG: chemotaxis protein CheD [Dehalococcoidia bacterium]|nr:chemotaxis protein CheD [Dehalococcoidia bacterium]